DVKFYKYNSRFYPCYKSYTNDDIKELNIMQHTNLLKHPVFLVLPIVLVLAIYLIFFKSSFATGDLFGSKKILKRADSIKSESQPDPLYAGAIADKIKSMDAKSSSVGVSQQGINPSQPSSISRFPENKGVDFISGSKPDQEVSADGVLFRPSENLPKPIRGKKYGECYSTGFVEKDGRKIELLDCGNYYKFKDSKDSGQP
ncbi:MAG: hypothetical protein Q8K02_17695, partial [Flavobacterium sp.]|nr:hypothetical protein [Flavobacterium sp.]